MKICIEKRLRMSVGCKVTDIYHFPYQTRMRQELVTIYGVLAPNTLLWTSYERCIDGCSSKPQNLYSLNGHNEM